MSNAFRWPIFFILLAGYGWLFSLQENHFAATDQQLAHPLPPTLQKAALGYLRQLGGEMLFVKASVFNGGLKPGRDPLDYAEPLAQHFTAAATLHPHFIDTYFLCQATLPYINNDYARRANSILGQGITAFPENIVLPFFAGFNHFYFLGEPLEAARIFLHAAQQPDAPPILEHLATLLTAEGGDIHAALISLRGMHASEKDEQVKKRYADEITAFEKAAMVLDAIHRYRQAIGQPPARLDDLVPGYLPAIPDVGPLFRLKWKPPHLGVVRAGKLATAQSRADR